MVFMRLCPDCHQVHSRRVWILDLTFSNPPGPAVVTCLGLDLRTVAIFQSSLNWWQGKVLCWLFLQVLSLPIQLVVHEIFIFQQFHKQLRTLYFHDYDFILRRKLWHLSSLNSLISLHFPSIWAWGEEWGRERGFGEDGMKCEEWKCSFQICWWQVLWWRWNSLKNISHKRLKRLPISSPKQSLSTILQISKYTQRKEATLILQQSNFFLSFDQNFKIMFELDEAHASAKAYYSLLFAFF